MNQRLLGVVFFIFIRSVILSRLFLLSLLFLFLLLLPLSPPLFSLSLSVFDLNSFINFLNFFLLFIFLNKRWWWWASSFSSLIKSNCIFQNSFFFVNWNNSACCTSGTSLFFLLTKLPLCSGCNSFYFCVTKLPSFFLFLFSVGEKLVNEKTATSTTVNPTKQSYQNPHPISEHKK